jgi:preprotein translocase subunit SecF
MDELKEEIEKIQERNRRVEADKAWETSFTRMAVLAVITYIVAMLALWVIGNDAPFVNALIPTIGFLLSVQSLPLVKRWWVRKYLSK